MNSIVCMRLVDELAVLDIKGVKLRMLGLAVKTVARAINAG